jgi:hypothetical protein
MTLTPVTGRIIFGMVLLTAALSTSSVLAHGDLRSAQLRSSEVPKNFGAANARVYTAYVAFLKVKVQGPYGKADDVCAPPSIVAGKYRQALIQSFGSTAVPTPSMRLCSFLYENASAAAKAYQETTRSAASHATSFPAHKTASRIGNDSVAYVGKTSEEVVFRSANVVVDLWYTSLKGVQMSPSAFLHLGSLLVTRLH